MKKLILIFLVLVLKFAPAKAQWVTIPDPEFVSYLTANYPSCMNGNQMDTTCSQIINEDTLDFSYDSPNDLTGVEHFINLISLKCTNNLFLSSLPTLPNSLIELDCSNNILESLPQLPSSLQYLKCTDNLLSSLPSLPTSLLKLQCDFNQITNLPELPSSLVFLSCSSNSLTSLPILPISLQTIGCNSNFLTVLPELPLNIDTLYCSDNLITSLPTLPNSLLILYCSGNQLTNLPTLPNSLNKLFCFYNQLNNLPTLPVFLNELSCYNNQLTNLPELPYGLTRLNCRNNQITALPLLPPNIFQLSCENNLLTYIPEVRTSMSQFRINNNNITCLFNLPNVSQAQFNANISNNPLTCVPNQTAYSGNLPLCIDNDTVNNPYNCLGVQITGRVYKDLYSDCAYSSFDLNSQNIPVKLFDSQNNFLAQSYTINGVYTFSTLLPDTFQVKIDTTNLPIALACGQSSVQSVVLNSANQTIQNINFPVVCNVAYDATVQSVSTSGWVFPGQIHTMRTNINDNETWYNLDCDNTTTSGTVSIQVNGPVSFVEPATGALTPIVSGNTFTYNIPDLNTLNPNSFGLRFMTDTTAQAGDQICVHVEISPNPIDADTTNNVYDFCYNVVNSYDPNMKEVYPVNVLPGYDDWFTYTIHFQNTGNAPAFNIRLRDTLDTQLDLNTFEVLGYSHPATIGVSGNILTVRFNNIMLPDSTSDYEGSMGYFQYRIKPFPNLPLGSQISNTAYIYFDFNPPIITNTTENNFEFPVSVSSIVSSENSFSLFPNPSTGIFTFKDTKNLNTVEVYSILGEKILSQTNQKTINLSGFGKGVYFVRVNGGVVLKMVKE
jgi:uncharacterized repeat protein (TIGR01451 family)